VDVDGYLINSSGHLVLSTEGNAIFIGLDAKANIGRDGSVSTKDGTTAKLGVFEFIDQQNLKAQGALMYKSKELATLSTSYSLVQGSLEASNVSLMKEAIALIEIQRLFEQAQKIIDEYEQIQRKAINVSGKN
jgi:flagellar basal-body rod protein FlgF